MKNLLTYIKTTAMGYIMNSTLIYYYFRLKSTPLLFKYEKPVNFQGRNPHCKIFKGNTFISEDFEIIPVPYFEDNYSYLIFDLKFLTCVVVDPGDPQLILNMLVQENWDHSAGNLSLLNGLKLFQKHFEGIKVYGGLKDFSGFFTKWYTGVKNFVNDKDEIYVGRLCFKVFETNWHTSGHSMYLFDPIKSLNLKENNDELALSYPCSLFCGDSFFSGGIGMFFEGSSVDLHNFFTTSFQKIPTTTLLWPGHEYAFTNFQFAKEVEPNNLAIQFRLKDVKHLKYINSSSVPTTLAQESQFNPFLRIHGQAAKIVAAKRGTLISDYGGGGPEEIYSSVKNLLSERVKKIEEELKDELKKKWKRVEIREDELLEILVLQCLRVLKSEFIPSKL
ncbi:hypothetical protein HK099_003450 [Clydaea vesicula]|uniref:hydroxyacylglutathione hydrolase n=1 Tax=Clydaea vesicula TaxID=447962 RepID=A0AAD5U1L9_9FUNG|nr:hypothetical protein HK099_003450 [Clydaea vesicula]